MERIDVLKYEAFATALIAIVLGGVFWAYYLFADIPPAIREIAFDGTVKLWWGIIAPVFFLTIAIIMFALYFTRNRGVGHRVDTALNTMRDEYQKNILQNEYLVRGKPKHVAFIVIYLTILFVLGAILNYLFYKEGMISPIFAIVRFVSIALMFVALILLWRLKKTGFILVCVLAIVNIILAIVSLQVIEMLFWIYPVRSLVMIKPHYFPAQTINTTPPATPK